MSQTYLSGDVQESEWDKLLEDTRKYIGYLRKDGGEYREKARRQRRCY